MSNNLLEFLADDTVVVLNKGPLARFEKLIHAARAQRDKKLQKEAMNAGFEYVEQPDSRKGAEDFISQNELKEQIEGEFFKLSMIFAFLLLIFNSFVFYFC